MGALDLLIALGPPAAFFAGGWLFLNYNLFRNYEDQDVPIQVGRCRRSAAPRLVAAVDAPTALRPGVDRAAMSPSRASPTAHPVCWLLLTPPRSLSPCRAQVVWSSMFSLSCNLLLLVCFEITSVISDSMRQLDWNLTVYCLLVLLLGVLPYFHTYRLLASSGEQRAGGPAARQPAARQQRALPPLPPCCCCCCCCCSRQRAPAVGSPRPRARRLPLRRRPLLAAARRRRVRRRVAGLHVRVLAHGHLPAGRAAA
jgi:hypothetical protein